MNIFFFANFFRKTFYEVVEVERHEKIIYVCDLIKSKKCTNIRDGQIINEVLVESLKLKDDTILIVDFQYPDEITVDFFCSITGDINKTFSIDYLNNNLFIANLSEENILFLESGLIKKREEIDRKIEKLKKEREDLQKHL